MILLKSKAKTQIWVRDRDNVLKLYQLTLISLKKPRDQEGQQFPKEEILKIMNYHWKMKMELIRQNEDHQNLLMMTLAMPIAVREGKLTLLFNHKYRLVQNRKSAMKCRLKKKNEFDEMKVKLDELKA